MKKLYKHTESGDTIVITDPNLESIMTREGFELVGDADEEPKKGKAKTEQ